MAWLSAAIQFQGKPALWPSLAEVCRLRGLVEHNDWHNDDPLRQSLRLARWVKRLPASLVEVVDAPAAAWTSQLNSIVDPPTGQHSVQALLTFAALIHDVGKAETFQVLPDGTTRCPGHEAVSARLAPIICARFDFTPVETRFIHTIVATHGEPYAVVKQVASLPAPQRQEQIQGFEAAHADHLLPLMLLACGDLVTSHLSTIRPEKYQVVINFYRLRLRRLCARENYHEPRCATTVQGDVR
jgi:hypothetical protein